MAKSYAQYNAQNVLDNINACIAELDAFKKNGGKYDVNRIAGYHEAFRMRAVYDELSIFDWWKEYLSLSQLKQMKRFVEQSIKLGFNGYVCFKVGAVGCANGMWAYKNESVDGFSPKGDAVYHSFVSDENYWDVCVNGDWAHGWKNQYKLADIKKILANA